MKKFPVGFMVQVVLAILLFGPFHMSQGSTSKVGELVAEISAACNERAQGIEQVNHAVADIDRILQQTATSANESAGASKGMDAQARQMKEVVESLVILVMGRAGAGSYKKMGRVS